MKKLLLITFAGIFATCIVACDKKDSDGKIGMYPTSLQFGYATETKTVLVEEGRNWSLDTDNDWISFEQEDGQFTVTVTENPDADPRSGSIIVSNSSDSKTLTVTQDGVDPSLTLSASSLTFTFVGGSENLQEVEVTSQPDWTVDSEEDWITIEETETGFNVIVDPYEGLDSRNGAIEVDNGFGTPKMVSVIQSGALVVEADYIEVYYQDEYDSVDEWRLSMYTNDWTLDMSRVFSSPVSDRAAIPEGTYHLEATEDGYMNAPYLISGYGWAVYWDSDVYEYDGAFDECTIVITGNTDNVSITLTAVDDNGTTWSVTYTGDYEVW